MNELFFHKHCAKLSFQKVDCSDVIFHYFVTQEYRGKVPEKTPSCDIKSLQTFLIYHNYEKSFVN